MGSVNTPYSLTDQQLDLGLRGMAVALKDRKGECVGALSTTMQVQSMSREETIARMLPLLQEAAQSLRPLL